MALNLTKRVVEMLTARPNQKFTAREISAWIFQNYREECEEKRKRSSARVIPLTDDHALMTQLVAEIGSQRPRMQKNNPNIKTTEGRPRKFYYSDSSDEDEVRQTETSSSGEAEAKGRDSFSENDLYPILSEFIILELNVLSKRIDERKSSNARGRGGNHWLYPDVVGMENLSDGWHPEINNCVKQYSDRKTKLWSFEVKKLINLSNIREVFFQAVSNSSWANYGYLVAADITGEKTMKELRILSGLHGIGCIRLDVDNPTESQIIIPAREKPDVDWDTASRLAVENRDFVDYIKLVRQFYQTGDVRKKDWDEKNSK